MCEEKYFFRLRWSLVHLQLHPKVVTGKGRGRGGLRPQLPPPLPKNKANTELHFYLVTCCLKPPPPGQLPSFSKLAKDLTSLLFVSRIPYK